MVKVRAFQGYTYRSEDYETLLKFDHQTLNSLPETRRAYINKAPIIDQVESGLLQRDSEPYFYVYKQVYKGKQTVGLMAEVDLKQHIDGKIKVHELTLCREGQDSSSYSQTHVGPIILSYKTASRQIEDILANITDTLKPFADWTTVDDRKHSLWKLPSATLGALFNNIDCLYVLDGHHRLKAASEWYRQTSFSPDAQWAQVMIYPSRSVSIFPFHRILEENEQFNFLHCASQKGLKHDFMKNADESTLQKYDILYKNSEGYFGFNLESDQNSEVGRLSVEKLKTCILDDLYGSNMDTKVSFVPGIINWNQLNGKYPSLCMVRAIKIEEIFRVADMKEIMPPKSTWFQPKPCNRMVIRLPFQL